ncbi:hypothetical protein NLG97_g2336 [Lecanicillium saksenae]|uniref:Uncharacterized protein n=1 Tax=Lecanicillium saksenae TaxID=468837 RepID=A0ACC1R2G1_9HYPO|nr:hypothetical protein NLG97_g2336 [Lecanicillium saksenae]
MRRQVGLTARAAPLLKVVNNRPRQTKKTPVDDNAPPMSTDDEDYESTVSEGTVQAAKASDRSPSPKRKAPRQLSPVDSDFDSSADERRKRASIKATVFNSKKRDDSTTSTKRRKVATSPERPKAKEKLKSGSHLRDKFGQTRQSHSKNTYGKRAKSSQSSQPDSSQDGKKLRVPSSIESPQKRKTSKFILPGSNIPSSPGSSPKKRLTQLNGTDDEDSILESLDVEQRGKKGKKKGKKKPSPPSSPPRAVFKLPQNFLDRSPTRQLPAGDAQDLSKLSSDDESLVGGWPKLNIPEELPQAPAAKCPWCSEEVDTAFLDDFSKGKRLNVRMQTRFCHLHKQRTAEQTWKDRKYPDIDWDTIERRFAEHHDHLYAIVDGKGSHFRDIHAKNVEEGRARSMKREENFNPGYYGPRGFNVMCDYLVNEFGDVLKRRAVDDRVIAGRGSAAFIQAVLVAELGVRLIMDDMKLSETKARQLMQDSKGLGELVQPETER